MGKILPDNVNMSLCEGCADCCKYVAVEIDEPESKQDHELVLSYLLHEGVRVFVEEDDDDEEEQSWFVEFKTRCDALRDDLLCGTYETRPNVCREYSPRDCPKNNPDGEGEIYQFNCPEDYLAFIRIKGFQEKIQLPSSITNEVVVEIDRPTENDDYDNIAWYLLHNGINVFNANGVWHIEFVTKPRALTNPELYSSVVMNPNQKQEVTKVEFNKQQEFSERKSFLEYLKGLGVNYKLKVAKGAPVPQQLNAAIPIVSM